MLLAARENTLFERQRSEREIGGKGSENCIKQGEGMMFKDTMTLEKPYEI